MSKESARLSQDTFVVDIQHKYVEGDKVTITIEGVVSELMPHTFIEPGYIVKVGKVALAVSERSLERIEVNNG